MRHCISAIVLVAMFGLGGNVHASEDALAAGAPLPKFGKIVDAYIFAADLYLLKIHHPDGREVYYWGGYRDLYEQVEVEMKRNDQLVVIAFGNGAKSIQFMFENGKLVAQRPSGEVIRLSRYNSTGVATMNALFAARLTTLHPALSMGVGHWPLPGDALPKCKDELLVRWGGRE